MPKIDHATITTKIIEILTREGGVVKFNTILMQAGCEQRELDRTLQNLRKAGKIEFVKGVGCGWKIGTVISSQAAS